MAVRIEEILISPGEHVFIVVGGEAKTFLLQMDPDGRCTLQGPMNENMEMVELSAEGIEHAAVIETCHGLYQGMALCGFLGRVPQHWPPGNHWVAHYDIEQITCEKCRQAAEKMLMPSATTH